MIFILEKSMKPRVTLDLYFHQFLPRVPKVPELTVTFNSNLYSDLQLGFHFPAGERTHRGAVVDYHAETHDVGR